MSYQVLARKWRPRKFAELVGQEHVVRALTNALDTGRMHHAYLFTGTRGVGKTTIARIFAKSLNCERGESADPCGECSVCTAVDAGRFVDLLEIDAASNTGVDDVREVIENAQYAPSRGRFKVYLVDEVHMLSKPAFNALLKTLEEPPPHVKFLLATTDPQKLPVTVLSRCLKFNLKRLLPEQITGQMRFILGAENITFEDTALDELARGADGSLRDGLSLLDQAIAYGGGALKADDVRAMLGSVARGQVLGLLQALAAGRGDQLLAECAQIASYAPDFGGVLDDLASALHVIQLHQLIPGYAGESADDSDNASLAQLADALSPDDVQLYYQIAVTGRRDLPMAPDARTGFEMAMLRMLAFRPEVTGEAPKQAPRRVVGERAVVISSGRVEGAPSALIAREQAPTQTAQVPPVVVPTKAKVPPAVVPTDAKGFPDWGAMIEQAGLRGPLGQLAQNAALRERDGQHLVLVLQPAHMHLAVEPMVSQMEERVSQAMGERIRLRFVSDSAPMSDTPAARAASARSSAQAQAEASIEQDPLVQTLKRDFGARVVPQSIKPLER